MFGYGKTNIVRAYVLVMELLELPVSGAKYGDDWIREVLAI